MNRKGQNVVEYLLVIATVVGVLIGASKTFLPNSIENALNMTFGAMKQWAKCKETCYNANGDPCTAVCGNGCCEEPAENASNCSDCACVSLPNTCTAPSPACGEISTGTDNCGVPCSIIGPSCCPNAVCDTGKGENCGSCAVDCPCTPLTTCDNTLIPPQCVTPICSPVTHNYGVGGRVANISIPSTNSGVTVPLTCPAGFTGTPSATCTTTAWNFAGQCLADCLPTTHNYGGGAVNVPGGQSGQTVFTTCPNNYSGNPRAVCNNGTFTSFPGTCRADCLATTHDYGGGAVNIPQTPAGQTYNPTCPAPRSGNPSAVCSNAGVWSFPGSCGLSCLATTHDYTGGTGPASSVPQANHLQTVSPTCPPLYSGNPRATCNNGNFTFAGTCITDCAQTTHNYGGGPVPVGPASNGQTVFPTCPNGWSGMISARCTNGTFTNYTGTCVQDCAPIAHDYGVGGNVAIINIPSIPNGITQSLTCPAGFTTGNPRARCTSPNLTYLGQCLMDCAPTTHDYGGGTVSVPGAASGQTVSTSCPSNYSGNPQAVCNNGTFTSFPGSCLADCLPTTHNYTDGSGPVSSIPQTPSGQTAFLSCPTNYTGNPSAICDNGTFTSFPGSCLADCAPTTHDYNGVIVPLPGATDGQTVTGTCPPFMNGTPRARCDNGNFTNFTGQCNPNCPAANLTFGSVSIAVPQTGGGSPPLVLTCPPGYDGNPQATCAPSGNWSTSGSCDPYCLPDGFCDAPRETCGGASPCNTDCCSYYKAWQMDTPFAGGWLQCNVFGPGNMCQTLAGCISNCGLVPSAAVSTYQAANGVTYTAECLVQAVPISCGGCTPSVCSAPAPDPQTQCEIDVQGVNNCAQPCSQTGPTCCGNGYCNSPQETCSNTISCGGDCPPQTVIASWNCSSSGSPVGCQWTGSIYSTAINSVTLISGNANCVAGTYRPGSPSNPADPRWFTVSGGCAGPGQFSINYQECR